MTLSLSFGKSPRNIAVIGAGPAGLMAAEVAAQSGACVTIYDGMPSPGRKFLLAGRGGLNLTHSEAIETFVERYGPSASRLRPALDAFGPAALRAWCEALGQPTFVGSSGRVFPQSFKTSPLLRAWLRRLDQAGVAFRLRHRWTGFGPESALRFATPDGDVSVAADATILALGGASWPQLGSDGGWTAPLSEAGIAIAPLRPANCGFLAGWSGIFRSRFEGQPLKNIALSFQGRSARGDAMLTASGIEGGVVYALSKPLREAIATHGEAVMHIALRPDLDAATLERRLSDRPAKQSLSTFLRKALKLAPAGIGLLQEAQIGSSEPPAGMGPARLAALVNAVPVRLTGTAPIGRAISTAGGIALDALDETFMLAARPGTFAAGEMLDWEAPTGGYLLQACFSTGAAAARGALAWLAKD